MLVLGGALSLLLCLLAIGAGVNVHFDYFRTIGEVVGVVPGGASAAEVPRLERAGDYEGMVVAGPIEGRRPGSTGGTRRSTCRRRILRNRGRTCRC